MTPPELRMIVVNSSKWPDDFAVHRMYCCPAKENGFDPSYRHYPAKYVANYVSKGARYIGVVAACVRLNKTSPAEVLWKFDNISDSDAIRLAEEVRATTKRNATRCLVFLQTQLTATEFEYDHQGGLQNSRVYFDLTDLAPTGVKDLAEKLLSTPWSALSKWKPE